MPKKKVDKNTVRIHTCFSPDMGEEFLPVCACFRKTTKEDARRLVWLGLATWISVGKRTFRDKICLFTELSQMTPRVATIEKAHIERAYASDHGLEDRVRIETYGQLTQETWQALVHEVPAWEFDENERRDYGIPVVYDTERTK